MKKLGSGIKNENNANWMGNKANYFTIHRWMRETYGKADKCDFADETCKGIFQWANKQHKSPRRGDTTLSRERNDWMKLCQSHNQRYDGRKRDEKGRFVWK